MSIFTASLNSGSNGNCYYIGNETEAVLIDAGLSCRETEKRLRRLNLDISLIKAVFISHEHSDHINGLCGLLKKYKFPVYISRKTLISSRLDLSSAPVMELSPYIPVRIGHLEIVSFPKNHDAADPCSFTISDGLVKIGVFTDIGSVCKEVSTRFADCHAVFLEANYDREMLEQGTYPYALKNRIRGGKGHLSNAEALHLFRNYRSPHLSHLFLSHLSKDNNCPDLAKSLFETIAGETEIVVASRFNETSLYYIEPGRQRRPGFIPKPVIKATSVNQLSLF